MTERSGMDFHEYVAARRSRLVQHAVGLGVAEDQAPGLVDTVLSDRRRRIEKSTDPDPEVYDALEQVVRGPWKHRGTALLVAALTALVLVVAGLVWWATRPPEQVTVPSAFSFDATDAGVLLRGAGLETGLRTVPVCEPPGLVLGSDPPAGSRVDIGGRVVLRSAVAPDDTCPGLADRRQAWAFLRFTRGGPAPRFDDTVFVVLDGREPAVLPAAAAADPDRWEGIQEVADAASRARDASGLTVTAGVPPAEQCGIPRPAAAGSRETLRLQIGSGARTGDSCPLTVDLYRDQEGVIDAVVIYPAG